MVSGLLLKAERLRGFNTPPAAPATTPRSVADLELKESSVVDARDGDGCTGEVGSSDVELRQTAEARVLMKAKPPETTGRSTGTTLLPLELCDAADIGHRGRWEPKIQAP